MTEISTSRLEVLLENIPSMHFKISDDEFSFKINPDKWSNTERKNSLPCPKNVVRAGANYFPSK
jgi:hypothetical protein